MGKQKKKPTISRLDRFIMKAFQFKNQTPEGFKEFLAETRSNHRRLMERIKFSGLPSDFVPDGAALSYILSIIGEYDQSQVNAMSFLRDFFLGYWIEHKIVYRVPPETLEFLDSIFKIDELNTSINELVRRACMEPILVDLVGKSNGENVFFATGPVIQDVLVRERKCQVTMMLSFLDEGNGKDTYIRVLGGDNSISVKKHLEDLKSDAENNPDGELRFSTDAYIRVLKVLAYIGYVSEMKETMGNVIIEDTSKHYKSFKLMPIPFLDSIPDLSISGGWISSGLCHHLGYLDRNHMRSDFEKLVQDAGIEVGHTFRAGIAKEEVVVYIKSMVLEWEYHKTVFQFSKETMDKIYSNYLDNICFDCISVDLLQYMPYATLVLSCVDYDMTVLASKCKNAKGDGIITEAIFLALFSQNGPEFFVIEASGQGTEPCCSSSAIDKIPDNGLEALALMWHILTVLKNKSLKKMTSEMKPAKSAGDVIGNCPALRRQRNIEDEEIQPFLVNGYTLNDEPFTLLDITPRTIKAVPSKHIAARIGWKMRPHVRRAHPHRYWVGRGENKHLEIRFVESTPVNCNNEKIQPTVVHKVDI